MNRLRPMVASTLAALLAAACGASSRSSPESGAGGTENHAGNGGAGAAGSNAANGGGGTAGAGESGAGVTLSTGGSGGDALGGGRWNQLEYGGHERDGW